MDGDAFAILSPRLAFCQTFFLMAAIIILENDEKSTTSCVYVINEIHAYENTKAFQLYSDRLYFLWHCIKLHIYGRPGVIL